MINEITQRINPDMVQKVRAIYQLDIIEGEQFQILSKILFFLNGTLYILPYTLPNFLQPFLA